MTTGMCECGCGEKTNLAPQTSTRRGWIKGKPLRYVLGHGNRKHPHGWDVVAGPLATSCWVWRGEKDRLGYPFRGTVLVYREMWEQKFGRVPGGLELDHLCRNTSCVNPDHLEAVTHAENIRRGKTAKITHDIAATIRSESGSLRAIGRKYGLHHTTVMDIRRGTSWT